jgi:CHAT domain-containing protein
LINEEEKAIAYYRQSLQLFYSTPNISSLKIALNNYNIAHCYYKANHLDTAVIHIYKALDVYTLKLSANSIEVADCYWLLAKVHRAKQEPTQAMAFIDKAISIKSSLLHNRHSSLYQLSLDKGFFLSKNKSYARSWQYLDSTLTKIQSSPAYGSTLTYFKLLNLQVNNSLQLSTSIQQSTFEYLAPLKTRIQQAIENTTLEGDERTFIDVVRLACENGLQLCYLLYQKTGEQRYLLQAFDLMECNKAVSLNFNIQKNKRLETLPDSLQTQYYQLRSAIQAIEYQLLDNNNAVENLHPQMLEYKKSLEAFHKKHFFQEKENIFISIPLDSLQNRLIAQEEQIISYFYGEQFIYAFTIEKENCYLNQITPNFDSLYNLFFKHLTQLQPSKNNLKKAAQTYEKVANHLAAKLLPPQLAPRLYIIPDGKLNYVPFGALVAYQTEEVNGFHALQYLIQKHEISYAASSTAFYRQQYLHQNQSKSIVTAFAPTYNHTYGLAPLVHTQQEIDYLSASFQGDFYTNKKATKANFTQLRTTSGLVHLALHGQADNDVSTLAKLFFSPSPEDSVAHILAAHEIIACPLRADMITLSGCQTGIGTFRAGEGVISLARDFMKIGIPTVLTTLWQVNDQSSSHLIQNFYTQINQTNKAAALQQAKLDYLNNASAFQAHPYFWSGYVLMGNTKALNLETKNNVFLWYLVPGLSLLFLIGLYFFIKTKK